VPGSVRCKPSTRMSLTLNGWNDCACAAAATVSVHAANTAARRLRIIEERIVDVLRPVKL